MTEDTPIREGWLTSKQVLDEFGIPDSTLREWAKDARLEFRHQTIGKTAFYWRDDITRIRKIRPGRGKYPRKGKGKA